MAKGISANWRIEAGRYRQAAVPGPTVSDDLVLMTTNRRTLGGWGPVRWWVFRNGRLVASGDVYDGVRYKALVREAMFRAERAAGL